MSFPAGKSRRGLGSSASPSSTEAPIEVLLYASARTALEQQIFTNPTVGTSSGAYAPATYCVRFESEIGEPTPNRSSANYDLQLDAVASGGGGGSSTPVMSVVAGNAIRTEGSFAAKEFACTVARPGVVTGASSANWDVSGTALTGADFASGHPPLGTASFAAGETSKKITLVVVGDATPEPDERLVFGLSSPIGATLGTATAVYSGRLADHVLGSSAGSCTVEGMVGTDLLTNIDQVRFADMTVNLVVQGQAPTTPQAFRKMPILPRMKISNAAPATATTKRRMPPEGAMPSSPAIQKPSSEPTTPTTTLAIHPICASVFMTMLASQPTIPPMINETIQLMCGLPM